MNRYATISDCGRYRYRLERILDGKYRAGGMCFVMLNPSTADADKDDATIRKLYGFARRWAVRRIVVVNLYAFRSTDPKGLLEADDPVGPENNPHILAAAMDCRDVVVAWGVNGARPQSTRPNEVFGLIRQVRGREPPLCLGRCKNGQPRHPLMLSYDTPLMRTTGEP